MGDGPGLGVTPNEPGAARTKHPFVGSRNQKVAAEVAETEVFDTQCMNCVYTEDDAILLISRTIYGSDRKGHLMNRQFKSRAGVHPGHGHNAGGRRDALTQGVDQLLV